MPSDRTSALASEPSQGREPVLFDPVTSTPQDWWLRAPELCQAIQRRPPDATWIASYRLGDAILAIDTDDRAIAESVRELFGECAVSGEQSALPRVRCTLRTHPDGEFVYVHLAASEPLDGLELFSSLLEPRPLQRCFVRPSPLAGWHLVGWKDSPRPIAAIQQVTALVRAPELRTADFFRDFALDFFRDAAAAAALRIQSGVLFLHAASVCVGGAGVLFTGRAGAGKTTLALTLGSRGHGLLGDDLAALRQESLELLPVRRTLHIRRGPRAARVEKALRERSIEVEAKPATTPRAVVQARNLFSVDPVAPSVLRAAFFLRAFRKRPGLERFVPSLTQMGPLRHLPIRMQWGITPARRVLRFAQAARCFARVPCYHLDVGLPEETADLIEKTVEDL
jgi:hypothetical protein